MNDVTLDFLGKARRALNLSFVTEGTGGGCTALVAKLEGGYTLVVTDGNFGTDLGSLPDVDPNAGLYRPGAWEGEAEDNSPMRDSECAWPVTADSLVAMVRETLG